MQQIEGGVVRPVNVTNGPNSLSELRLSDKQEAVFVISGVCQTNNGIVQAASQDKLTVQPTRL